MKFSEIIDNLLTGNELSQFLARYSFSELLGSKLNPIQTKTFLVLLQKSGLNNHQLAALAATIRKRNRVNLNLPRRIKLSDACGTGGDSAGTFNISTISSIVAAAAGAVMAKHGNRSVTSKCGSSDLMESLGINLNPSPSQLKKCLRLAHIAYFHAPVFSHQFRHIQPIRRELAEQKIKTIFNLVGPLVNPAGAKRQLLGIYDAKLVKVVALALSELGTERALVFHNCSRHLDELIPGDDILAYEVFGRRLRRCSFNWKHLKLRKPKSSALRGGGASLNKRIAIEILRGKDRSERQDVVILNAGAILYVAGRSRRIKDGVSLARSVVCSGQAYKTLLSLTKASHGS